MKPVRSVETMGYKVFSDDLSVIPIRGAEGRVLNTISPNSYGVATKDIVFRDALRASDYLVLDGVYFAFASMMLQGKNIKRNQGPDVFYHFMERLQAQKGSAFFMGSSPSTLSKIETNAATRYPDIRVGTWSPPFKDTFSQEENDRIIAEVNAFAPDVLFVGMTCPKQEKWAIANRHALKAPLIICIGNVFDWFAGTQKIIHPIWFKLRLGWLVRIFLRPEIFRRNIGNQMKFFRDVILVFLRLKKPA